MIVDVKLGMALAAGGVVIGGMFGAIGGLMDASGDIPKPAHDGFANLDGATFAKKVALGTASGAVLGIGTMSLTTMLYDATLAPVEMRGEGAVAGAAVGLAGVAAFQLARTWAD